MNLAKYTDLLMEIENKITENYLALYSGEVIGKIGELEYEMCFQEIIRLIEKEKQILLKINENYSLSAFKAEITKYKASKKEIPLTLGHLIDAEVYRLYHIIDTLTGDDLLDYASTLKTDINRLILDFLDNLINNPYYQDIRNDLILYRYNLIYLDPYLESDFLNDMLSTDVSLEASKYRTPDLPSYIFVDKSLLVLESLDFIEYIRSHDEQKENSNTYALIVIAIINILSRLVLCDEQTLDLIYDDLAYLTEDDEISLETKNLINDMQTILKSLQNHIAWSR